MKVQGSDFTFVHIQNISLGFKQESIYAVITRGTDIYIYIIVKRSLQQVKNKNQEASFKLKCGLHPTYDTKRKQWLVYNCPSKSFSDHKSVQNH